ncbi:MAG: 2Fe-2S iron-sulfur cluster-binding protein [Acidimicrobiales bacterium]
MTAALGVGEPTATDGPGAPGGTSGPGAGTFVPLTVTGVERLTPDSVVVALAGGGPEMRFAPGQHLVVRRFVEGAELRRTYSLCASAASGELQIAVKRLPGGAFSEWANSALAPGDVLEAMPPKGRFGPRPDPGAKRRYVAVAAGSGVTPVLSIVRTLLEVEPRSTVALWYGNRSTGEAMFVEELCDLKDRFVGRFEVLWFMSREEQEVELFNGRLDGARVGRLLRELEPPSGVDEWYLCGPFEMVTQVKAVLLAAGAGPGRVHMELFHVEGEAPVASRAARSGRPTGRHERTSEVTVVLSGRATKLAMPFSGETVLDALTSARSDAPYSCKSGVCGTCRAKLLTGSVEMDACYALERDETDAGYVLMCQSHPSSDHVRLQVD